jgi:hypothetical protein
MRVIFFLIVWHFKTKGTVHQTLISCCDLLWCSPIDTVSVVTATYQKGTEHDSEVKTVSSLELEYIGRRRNNLRQLVGNKKLFIFQEVSYKLGTFGPLIEFSVGEFGRSDCSANELPLATLIARSKKELSGRVVDYFELAFILQDMFQY